MASSCVLTSSWRWLLASHCDKYVLQDGVTLPVVTGKGKQRKRAGQAPDADLEAHQQERRDSNGKASSSMHASVSGTDTASERKSAAVRKKLKQQPQTAGKVFNASAPSNSGPDVAKASLNADQTPAATAAPTAGPAEVPVRADSTEPTDSPMFTEPAKAALGGSKPAGRLLGSKSASLPPFALPGSASHPSLSAGVPAQAASLLSRVSTSTRISMPPGLTQLSSLRSKASVPAVQDTASPDAAEQEAEAAAAAAAVEAHLKTTMQQFDALLQNTLQRTKESVHKVTQFAVKAALARMGNKLRIVW